MRHSYGTVDRRNILLYKPQLFHRTDDLLIFPSRDLEKWHSEILELLDGIYQINSRTRDQSQYVDMEDLNLTMGLLHNINEEMETIFNPSRELDFSYQYVSMVAEEYKKRQGNFYGRYIDKVNRRVITITPEMKWKHQMEILDEAHKMWSENKDSNRRFII
ncbi:hypothetical protein [Methanobacterium sp.]|uniref:hypothetical protein n=1 Tax=Methanobacterium sp. TaxID=2164 RepID=UPI002AB86548|nr:hypothetical protein [Methanobacterium sp.]MDY9922810.1 hypothetical protein [Methanobacterium sp.]